MSEPRVCIPCVLIRCGLLMLSAAAATLTIPKGAWADEATPNPPPDVSATTQLEEIMVTATKTDPTSVQNVPIAVSAFSGKDLADSQVTNFRELAEYTPNLSVTENTGQAQVYLRGIGSNNVFVGSDPSVSMNVDGVYIARPSAQFSNFLDVDRVEVLRGPQGTLYGRNSIGGAINIISRAPGDDFQAATGLTVGNYGAAAVDGYASGPLIPGAVEASIAGEYQEHSPYWHNIVPTGNDVGNEDQKNARGQLRVHLAPNLEATTRLDGSWSSNAPESYSFLKQAFSPDTAEILGSHDDIAANTPSHMEQSGWGIAEDINWTLGDHATIRSLTAYRHIHYKLFLDSDATELSIVNTGIEEAEHQLSEELDLNLKYDSFDLVSGAYFLRDGDWTHIDVFIVPQSIHVGIHPTLPSQSSAVFTQGTYHATSKLAFTAGVRYTAEKKDVYQNQTVYLISTEAPIPGTAQIYHLSPSWTAVTPKFDVEYTVNDSVLTYLSATRGFKSGGINIGPSSEAAAIFAPETLWSYEAGLKSTWLDRRLRLNAAAYYYDFKGLQVLEYVNLASADITNAAAANEKGVEVEAVAVPMRNLELGATLTWADGVYSSYPNAPTLGGGRADATGHQLDNLPRYSAAGTAQYSWNLLGGSSLFVRGEYSWKGRMYFTPQNDELESQEAYGVGNLFAGYQSPARHWVTTVFVKNLSNAFYDTSTATLVSPVGAHVGDPRTYGLQLNWVH
jgi:iron complex outermembrane receptor protein